MPITLYENFRALFYAPFYAAVATGACAAEGLDLVLKDSPDGSVGNAALRSGEADMMWGGPLRVIMGYDKNPNDDLVCFCDVVSRDPFFVIGREPRPGFTIADLARVKLAVVSEVPTPWLCLKNDIRRAGIDTSTLDVIQAPSMAENTAALARGELDAVQLFQPYAEELLESGAGHVWYAQADRGLTAYTTLVTRREVLEKRPEMLLAMCKAMRRSLAWIAATPGTEIAAALKSYFPDVPPARFAAAAERYKALGLWSRDCIIHREGFDRLHESMLTGGAISTTVRYEDCVDTSIAAQAC